MRQNVRVSQGNALHLYRHACVVVGTPRARARRSGIREQHIKNCHVTAENEHSLLSESTVVGEEELTAFATMVT